MKTFTLSKKSDEIKKLEDVAQNFLNTNAVTLKNTLAKYADLDDISDNSLREYVEDQKIFFLSGQSIANIFNSDKTFSCFEYNDLDIFVLTSKSIAIDRKLKTDNDTYENTDAFKNVTNPSTILSIYAQQEKIYLKNMSQNISTVPQFIDVYNHYIFTNSINVILKNMSSELNVDDLLNRSAYKIIDDFDLSSVKIGILVNRDLTRATLIVHENYLDNEYRLPIPSRANMISVIRSLRKAYNSNLAALGDEAVQEYINIINQNMDILQTATWYSNQYKQFVPEIQVPTGSKALMEWADAISKVELNYYSTFDSHKYNKKFKNYDANRNKLNNLMIYVDDLFEYNRGIISIKSEKKFDNLYLDESLNLDKYRLQTDLKPDIVTVCEKEMKITNTEHYKQFINNLIDFYHQIPDENHKNGKSKDDIYKKGINFNINDIMVFTLFCGKNYDELAKKYTPYEMFLLLVFIRKLYFTIKSIYKYFSKSHSEKFFIKYFDGKKIISKLSEHFESFLNSGNARLCDIIGISSLTSLVPDSNKNQFKILLDIEKDPKKVFSKLTDNIIDHILKKYKIINDTIYSIYFNDIMHLAYIHRGIDNSLWSKMMSISCDYNIHFIVYDYINDALYIKNSDKNPHIFSNDIHAYKSFYIYKDSKVILYDVNDPIILTKNIVKTIKFINFIGLR